MIIQLLFSFTLISTSFCAITNRIVGGHEIKIEEAPYQVAVLWDSHFFCGGSLISKDFVLSAAHCFDESYPDFQLNVRVGSSKLKDGNGMSINVGDIYKHPLYDPTTGHKSDYDFALLRLYDVDNFPSVVQFAKLPTVYDKLNDGDEVFISGWGKTEHGVNSDVLLGATVKIHNFDKCSKYYMNPLTTRMICAGEVGGKIDTCSGDSGGPLVRKSDGILFGVTSFGGKICGDAPGVYAKVSYVLGWICETLNYSNMKRSEKNFIKSDSKLSLKQNDIRKV